MALHLMEKCCQSTPNRVLMAHVWVVCLVRDSSSEVPLGSYKSEWEDRLLSGICGWWFEYLHSSHRSRVRSPNTSHFFLILFFLFRPVLVEHICLCSCFGHLETINCYNRTRGVISSLVGVLSLSTLISEPLKSDCSTRYHSVG